MFNKGDLIVCINNTDESYFPKLTLWKQYKVYEVTYDGVVRILNDDENPGLYNPDRFLSIQQARENKLNKILDDKNRD